MIKKFIAALTAIGFVVVLNAQKITISGHVKDKNTGEPIPFANVWIKGTIKGVHTDENAGFSLETVMGDVICASSVGYMPAELVVKKEGSRNIEIFLCENVLGLGEVIVRPEVDYGKVLFDSIIMNKKHNREKISSIRNFKELVNTTIYLAIDTNSGVKRFIYDFEEFTTSIDNQKYRFTPIFLTEEANGITDSKSERLYGFEKGIFPKLNQTIKSNVLQYLVVDLDFYRNQLYIFDRAFISPISDNAMMYYNIYFNDSTYSGNSKIYNFSFTPKNRYAKSFTGNFSVNGNDFSLLRVEVYLLEDANINFVNGFSGKVTYKSLPDGRLFLERQEIGMNLSLVSDKDSVAVYGSQRLNEISNGDWLLNKTSNFSVSDNLENINARDWKNQKEFLTKETADDYKRIDKLKDQPAVKTVDAIGGIVLTSFVNLGKFDVGPVYDIYTNNAVEGNRFSLPLRTGEQMFKYFTIGGIIGYGTKSRDVKYGANIGWQPFKTDKFIVRLSYADDYSLISQDKFLRFVKKNPNTRGNGNFVASLTTRERDPYLKEEKRYEARIGLYTDKTYELELSPYYIKSSATDEVRFVRGETDYGKYKNYGFLFNFRFAFRQHFDRYYFDRIYFITQIPVINLSTDIGKVKLPGTEINDLGIYLHFHGSILGYYNFGYINMRYMVNGGYLTGNAPYDMLDMPVGTMSFGYSKYGYNLLHHATFANNLYTNVHLDFNGGGILLNHIPGIRELKLREVISVKCHYGSMNDAYKKVFELPGYYDNKMTYPYTEIGIGFTNIFKILRIEYVRQGGNYHKKEHMAYKQGIFLRGEMSF